MITDSFLNSCFSVLLNKTTKVKRTKTLYRDIAEIIRFNESRDANEIPISIQSKLECLKKIIELLLNDKTVDNLIDSIILSDKFKQYSDFLDVKINEQVNELIAQDNIKQIRLRKKYASLVKNYNELEKIVNTIKDGSFDSVDDLVEDYEINVKELYTNVMESNRSVSIEASASLDLVKDDYSSVVEKIKRKYERENKTLTGFSIFDRDIFYGGYEPSRLYVFAGGSGAGKSTFLNNTIIRSATTNLNLVNKNYADGKINRVFIYVTMENTIEESLMRTYQPMFDRTSKQMIEDINNFGISKIKELVMTELAKNGSTIIMKYFPATTISAFDLMNVVDDVIQEYGKESVAGLYVDYLDLLKTETKYDMYRLELGHIALSLKTVAVQYNIPVITASQLSRRVYSIEGAKDLSLDQMSESIKKVEHADVVVLLGKDKFDKKVIYGMVGKNRNGMSDVAIQFNVDFERFKFIDCSYYSNKEKKDASSHKSIDNFSGFLGF